MMNNRGCIYKLHNIINNKCYYGSTNNIKERYNCHIISLKGNYHSNYHLQNAWNKYGEDNFKFEIIEKNITRDKLIEREQYWLDYTKCYLPQYGYNNNPIANIPPSWKGKHRSEEFKKKMSEVAKKRGISKETRRKMIKAAKNNPNYGMRGKYHTEKTKRKMSLARKGIKLSEETKRKLSKAHIGMKMPPFTKEHKIKISKARKGKCTGIDHFFYGKHLSKKHKENISKSNKGKVISSETRLKISKTLLNFYNEYPEIKERIRQNVKNLWKNPLYRENISKLGKERTGSKNPFFSKHHTEETKEKMSKSHIGRPGLKGEKKILIGEAEFLLNPMELDLMINLKKKLENHY